MGNVQGLQSANGGEVMVYNPDLRTCAFCGKAGDKLRRCARCRTVAYCDRTCQKQDWKQGHKQVCEDIVFVAKGNHPHKTFEACFGDMGVDFHAWKGCGSPSLTPGGPWNDVSQDVKDRCWARYVTYVESCAGCTDPFIQQFLKKTATATANPPPPPY